MPTKPLYGALLAALLGTSAQAASLDIQGSGLHQEHHCSGEDVSIAGNANQIVLRGTCGSVLVQGWDLQVTLDKARTLRVNGANNQVRVDRTAGLNVEGSGNQVRATLAAGEPPAQVEVTGAEHLLDLHFNGPARVSLGGMEHRLDWHGQQPEIEVSGVRHQIDRW